MGIAAPDETDGGENCRVQGQEECVGRPPASANPIRHLNVDLVLLKQHCRLPGGGAARRWLRCAGPKDTTEIAGQRCWGGGEVALVNPHKRPCLLAEPCRRGATLPFGWSATIAVGEDLTGKQTEPRPARPGGAQAFRSCLSLLSLPADQVLVGPGRLQRLVPVGPVRGQLGQVD